MSTISISIPAKQKSELDQMVKQHGFANRSELIRALMRFVGQQPEVLSQVASFPFVTTKDRSAKKILKGFSDQGYSKEFLADLKEGLQDSTYFS